MPWSSRSQRFMWASKPGAILTGGLGLVVGYPFALRLPVDNAGLEVGVAALGVRHLLQVEDRARPGAGVQADDDQAGDVATPLAVCDRRPLRRAGRGIGFVEGSLNSGLPGTPGSLGPSRHA